MRIKNIGVQFWPSWINKFWPVILIILLCTVYFAYILADSRYFFYDDFTAFTFVVPRSYSQVIIDSLKSGDIDRHKITGYLVIKFLYDTIGLRVEGYFLFLYLVHLVNSLLVYWLLLRVTGKRWVSGILAAVFAWRFYLGWIANIENYLAGLGYFISLHFWLSFCETGKRKYIWGMLAVLLPMVYAYGPSLFLYPALIPLTGWLYGWRKLKSVLPQLLPFGILLLVYVAIYSQVPDSLSRFADPGNPYYRPVSLVTFIKTQAIYVAELTRYLPAGPEWIAAAGIMAVVSGLGWPLLTFWLAILPNSFFPNHTMWYYLYFPIVFLLIGIARRMSKSARAGVWLVGLLLVFNPFWEIPKVLFRLRHPSLNFEKQAMAKIVTAADGAVRSGSRKVQLSNWEVTPNLHGAITYQALPLFMSSPGRQNYVYSYDRTTEVLTLIPRLP